MTVIQLRYYQKNVIEGVRQAIRAGARLPLVVVPTGGGKTPTAGFIAHQSSSNGKRVLFVAHRQELVTQASLTFAKLGIRHQLVVAGQQAKEIESQQWRTIGRSMVDSKALVTVASVQTYIRRMEALPDPDVILIDEAHHVSKGNTWGKVFDAYPKAIGVGFTATPERLDGKGLGAHADGYFQQLVMGPQVQELIDGGYLAQPEVYVPDVIDMRGAKKSGGDYTRGAAKERMGAAVYGSAVDHYGRLCPGEPAVAFCVDVGAAQDVAEQFRAAGWAATSVDGTLSDTERRERLGGLASGKYQVVTSADLIGEGLDIPAIRAAIMLRPTDSLGLYRQQAGRALRPAPGKSSAIILDHVGNTLKHGLITDEIEWTLDGRKGRGGNGPSEPDINVRQCPECFFAHEPQPTCPHCGFVYPHQGRTLKQVEAELKILDDARIAQMRADKKKKQQSCKTVADFLSAGFSKEHAERVLEAREAKERLRDQLRDELAACNSEQVNEAGIDPASLMRMKPKELQQAIDALRQQQIANDNQPPSGFGIRKSVNG